MSGHQPAPSTSTAKFLLSLFFGPSCVWLCSVNFEIATSNAYCLLLIDQRLLVQWFLFGARCAQCLPCSQHQHRHQHRQRKLHLPTRSLVFPAFHAEIIFHSFLRRLFCLSVDPSLPFRSSPPTCWEQKSTGFPQWDFILLHLLTHTLLEQDT